MGRVWWGVPRSTDPSLMLVPGDAVRCPLSAEAAAMCTLDQKKGTARLKKILKQLRAIVERTFLPSIASMVNDLNFPDPES